MKNLLSILILLSIVGINLEAEAQKTYKECTFIFCTDIFDAVRKGDIEFVKSYIAAGADVNVRSRLSGETPLHWAVRNDRLAIAQLLVSAGADVNAQDNEGRTPLYRAIYIDDSTTTMIQFLRNEGATE